MHLKRGDNRHPQSLTWLASAQSLQGAESIHLKSLDRSWAIPCVQHVTFCCDNGEGGIRTPVRCDPKLDFESSAFNRSATSPHFLRLEVGLTCRKLFICFPILQGSGGIVWRI